jgi:hypothetical protein
MTHRDSSSTITPARHDVRVQARMSRSVFNRMRLLDFDEVEQLLFHIILLLPRPLTSESLPLIQAMTR